MKGVLIFVIVVILLMLMYKCSGVTKEVRVEDILISYLNKPMPDSILTKYKCKLAGGDGTWLKYECYDSYPTLYIYVELDTKIVKRIKSRY